uniref:Ribosomal protein 63, mitochondrial n=1 Tax=Strigamia maritima TaxID=126957 RepID=T1JI72_STRMM
MHLTRFLLKAIAPGNIWRGKHRVYRPIKFHHKVEVFRTLAREEENSFYLTRPYLTQEQEFRSGYELGAKQKRYERTIGKSKLNMLPNKTTPVV